MLNVVHKAVTPNIFLPGEMGVGLCYAWSPITANTVADLL